MALSRVGTEGVSDASIKAADLNADVITGMAAASPAAAADDDVILVYDTSASALKKMTRGIPSPKRHGNPPKRHRNYLRKP